MRRSLAILAILAAALPAAADHHENTEPEAAPDQAAAMQAWMDAMTPGEMHETLNAFAGAFETTTSMWMQGPDGPATQTSGSASQHWTLGGRYLRLEYQGSLMGMPMTGEGYLGYDNLRKHYVMIWLDNFGTAPSVATGSFGADGKTLSLFGRMDEPTTGEIDKVIKYVYRLGDEKGYTFEVHDFAFPEGQTMVVQVDYRRQ